MDITVDNVIAENNSYIGSPPAEEHEYNYDAVEIVCNTANASDWGSSVEVAASFIHSMFILSPFAESNDETAYIVVLRYFEGVSNPLNITWNEYSDLLSKIKSGNQNIYDTGIWIQDHLRGDNTTEGSKKLTIAKVAARWLKVSEEEALDQLYEYQDNTHPPKELCRDALCSAFDDDSVYSPEECVEYLLEQLQREDSDSEEIDRMLSFLGHSESKTEANKGYGDYDGEDSRTEILEQPRQAGMDFRGFSEAHEGSEAAWDAWFLSNRRGQRADKTSYSSRQLDETTGVGGFGWFHKDNERGTRNSRTQSSVGRGVAGYIKKNGEDYAGGSVRIVEPEIEAFYNTYASSGDPYDEFSVTTAVSSANEIEDIYEAATTLYMTLANGEFGGVTAHLAFVMSRNVLASEGVQLPSGNYRGLYKLLDDGGTFEQVVSWFKNNAVDPHNKESKLAVDYSDFGSNSRFLISPSGEFQSWDKPSGNYSDALADMEEQDEDLISDLKLNMGNDLYKSYKDDGYLTGVSSSGNFLIANTPELTSGQAATLLDLVRNHGLKNVVLHVGGNKQFFGNSRELMNHLSPIANS